MIRWALLFLIAFLAIPLVAEIYKVVDKNGKVTYTNSPPNGKSELVEVKEPMVLAPVPNIPVPSQNFTENYSVPYEVAITSPQSGLRLGYEDRSIAIEVSVNQELSDGDWFVYKVDGKEVSRSTDTQYVLDEPPRGEHQISVDIVDKSGSVLASSEAVSVLVVRPPPKAKK